MSQISTEEEQARRMKAAFRAKEQNPSLTAAAIARHYGVNVATLRVKLRKAAGPALSRSEEARLLGYADGLYKAGHIVDKQVLLDGAHRSQFESIKYPKTARNLQYVNASWLEDFLDRNPEICFRSRAQHDNAKIYRDESFENAVKFWEELARTSLKYRIFDASQVWYLNETSYFAQEQEEGGYALGAIKRYESDLYEWFDPKRPVITSLTAYSAAGQLLDPTLIFRAEEVETHGFSSAEGGIAIATSETEDGMRSEKEEFEWMEKFEKFSRPFVQPEQWRLLLMDSTSLPFEVDYYAREHKIRILNACNLDSVHHYLVQPADIHVFTDITEFYRDTEDPELVDDDSLLPQGFYDTLSSYWGTAFAHTDICRNAFAEAGIFPVDMSRNEKVTALKRKSQEFLEGLKSDRARLGWELERGIVLESQRVKELIDERLSRTTIDASSGQPISDIQDYLLLKYAREQMNKQSEENEHLRKCIADLREVQGKGEGRESAISAAASGGEKVGVVHASGSEVLPLGSKRTVPQTPSPAKRRRMDEQCNVYGMV